MAGQLCREENGPESGHSGEKEQESGVHWAGWTAGFGPRFQDLLHG